MAHDSPHPPSGDGARAAFPGLVERLRLRFGGKVRPLGGGRQPVFLVPALVTALDLVLFSSFVTGPPGGTRSSPTLEVAFAAAGLAVLVVRRRAPALASGGLSLHSIVASLLLGYSPVLTVCVALSTAVVRSQPRRALIAVLFALASSGAWVASEVRSTPEVTSWGQAALIAVGYMVLILVAVGIGIWYRVGTERVSQLERSREEDARLAVAAERRRVARELHDIVAHTVSLMVLQAAGARRILRMDPARAEDALGNVEDAGIQAMGELGRLLGILRADGGDNEGSEAHAQRGLADIDELVRSVSTAGVEVTVDVQGDRRQLDPSVELAVYRVVQEALTNVTKHAGHGTRASVKLGWHDDALLIDVRDDGRGHPRMQERLSSGHGLLGLSERVVLVGGTLRSQPCEGGGFEVRATLPIAPPPQAPLTATEAQG